ncbi:MAG: Crp/Fnr family transcriptional regulator [Bdellovibrionota bacterium]
MGLDGTRQDSAAEREAFLATAPLLEGLPKPLLQQLASEMVSKRFERGDQLFLEGQEAKTFYLARQGWVKILRQTSGGGSVLFELLGPGDMVGAVAVLDQRPFPATAVAATSVEVLLLPGSRFRILVNQYPDLQKTYMREIGDRMRQARDWQAQIASRVEGRIAQLFLRLAERMGRREGAKIRFPRVLTRQEIADMVGTTVETAIRVLSGWNKSGLVLSEEEEFVITDLEKLVALAQEHRSLSL